MNVNLIQISELKEKVEKKRLGKTNLMVSPVAMGGIPIMRLEKDKAAKVVEKVLDLGINFIDTAWAYQDSEEKIGLALKGRNRQEVMIASKSPAVDRKTLIQQINEGLKGMLLPDKLVRIL